MKKKYVITVDVDLEVMFEHFELVKPRGKRQLEYCLWLAFNILEIAYGISPIQIKEKRE